jgi:hypothetical protein
METDRGQRYETICDCFEESETKLLLLFPVSLLGVSRPDNLFLLHILLHE